MKTVVPVGDPKAVKRWAAGLVVDTAKKSYFEKKFIGDSDNDLIQRLTDLESGAGDTIVFDLSLQLQKRPIYGDDRAQGKSEELKFAQDKVMIDQMRAPVSAGGRMTRKRTLHNMRAVARARSGDYWSRFMDEMIFIFVDRAHRNGVGRALMRFVLDDLRKRGVRRFNMAATTDPRAEKLFARMGFRPFTQILTYSF